MVQQIPANSVCGTGHLPPFHLAGIYSDLIQPMGSGTSIVLFQLVYPGTLSVTPEATIDLFSKIKIDCLMTVPSFLVAWAKDEQAIGILQKLKFIVSDVATSKCIARSLTKFLNKSIGAADHYRQMSEITSHRETFLCAFFMPAQNLAFQRFQKQSIEVQGVMPMIGFTWSLWTRQELDGRHKTVMKVYTNFNVWSVSL